MSSISQQLRLLSPAGLLLCTGLLAASNPAHVSESGGFLKNKSAFTLIHVSGVNMRSMRSSRGRFTESDGEASSTDIDIKPNYKAHTAFLTRLRDNHKVVDGGNSYNLLWDRLVKAAGDGLTVLGEDERRYSFAANSMPMIRKFGELLLFSEMEDNNGDANLIKIRELMMKITVGLLEDWESKSVKEIVGGEVPDLKKFGQDMLQLVCSIDNRKQLEFLTRIGRNNNEEGPIQGKFGQSNLNTLLSSYWKLGRTRKIEKKTGHGYRNFTLEAEKFASMRDTCRANYTRLEEQLLEEAQWGITAPAQTCPICLEKLEGAKWIAAHAVHKTPEEIEQMKKDGKWKGEWQVGHCYHTNCLRSALNVKEECPTCRHEVKKDDFEKRVKEKYPFPEEKKVEFELFMDFVTGLTHLDSQQMHYDVTSEPKGMKPRRTWEISENAKGIFTLKEALGHPWMRSKEEGSRFWMEAARSKPTAEGLLRLIRDAKIDMEGRKALLRVWYSLKMWGGVGSENVSAEEVQSKLRNEWEALVFGAMTNKYRKYGRHIEKLPGTNTNNPDYRRYRQRLGFGKKVITAGDGEWVMENADANEKVFPSVLSNGRWAFSSYGANPEIAYTPGNKMEDMASYHQDEEDQAPKVGSFMYDRFANIDAKKELDNYDELVRIFTKKGKLDIDSMDYEIAHDWSRYRNFWGQWQKERRADVYTWLFKQWAQLGKEKVGAEDMAGRQNAALRRKLYGYDMKNPIPFAIFHMLGYMEIYGFSWTVDRNLQTLQTYSTIAYSYTALRMLRSMMGEVLAEAKQAGVPSDVLKACGTPEENENFLWMRVEEETRNAALFMHKLWKDLYPTMKHDHVQEIRRQGFNTGT